MGVRCKELAIGCFRDIDDGTILADAEAMLLSSSVLVEFDREG